MVYEFATSCSYSFTPFLKTERPFNYKNGSIKCRYPIQHLHIYTSGNNNRIDKSSIYFRSGFRYSAFLSVCSRRCFLSGSFFYAIFHIVFGMLPCLFLAALWLPAAKGLTSWLSCLLWFCYLQLIRISTPKLRVKLVPLNMFKPSSNFLTVRSKATLSL